MKESGLGRRTRNLDKNREMGSRAGKERKGKEMEGNSENDREKLKSWRVIR